MTRPIDVTIRRYPLGWAFTARWSNAAGERRSVAKFNLGPDDLQRELLAAAELADLTAHQPGLCRDEHQPEHAEGSHPDMCATCSEVTHAAHARR